MEQNKYGTMNSDGSIAEWPEVDLNGSVYDHGSANRAEIGGGRFVIVPVNTVWTDELKASLTGSTQAHKAESFGKKRGAEDVSS